MGELQDYSGDFKPDLKAQDFSKEALERLWDSVCKLYVGLDGLWYNLIRDRFGEQMARELDREIWSVRGASVIEVRRTREALHIWGDDVISWLKLCQVDPGVGRILDMEIEIKNKNHGILTATGCRALEYWERHKDTELQKHICGTVDVEGFQIGCSQFNPKMKASALKLPPRKSPREIACQWEFTIEE